VKIAIFGGSFNPIHFGHIAMVETLINSGEYDEIIVVPTGLPPHKESLGVSGEHRLNMCSLAFKDEFYKSVKVSDFEVNRGVKSYTIDTLLRIREEYRGKVRECGKSQERVYISLVIGEDSANYFYTWRDYKWILELARVTVFRREELVSQKAVYGDIDSNKSNSSLDKERRELRESYKKRLKFIDAPLFNYSSSEIRERIKLGEDIATLLPDKVKVYVEINRLYK